MNIAQRVLARYAARSLKAFEATFKKLRSGEWGLVVNSEQVQPGDSVLTVTKAGKREQKIVGKVIWRGNGVAICEIATSGGGGSSSRRRPGGRYECEECGDYVEPGTRCWETGMIH
jgi:hypothetical protein